MLDPMDYFQAQLPTADMALQQANPLTAYPTAYGSPVMRMAAQQQQPSYAPTTGAEMEADSRSSIDKILARMQAAQEANHQNDRNMQWMSFFSKLAASKSPSLLQGLGEGSEALAETTGKQQATDRLLQQSNMENELKTEEWKQEQERLNKQLAQTGAYQQGELGLKRAALEQGKYTITPDGLGGFLKVNNKTGETESINSPIGQSASATDANGNPLTGDEYLKTLDPRIARTAKMVANGDMAWPGGFALKSPYWQNVIAAAQQYDPTSNGNRFPSVQKFNVGPQGNQIRAFDVGLSHLNTLSGLADALNNNDTKALNKVSNTWKEQTGNPAPTNFNAAKEVVGNEIVKAIVGAGGGVTDRDKAQQAINAANSPEQLKGVIDTYKTLMNGQLGGLKQQYENSTGRKDFEKRLSPVAQKEFSGATQTMTSVPSEKLPDGITQDDLDAYKKLKGIQ